MKTTVLWALLTEQTAAATEVRTPFLFSEFDKRESYWPDQNRLRKSGCKASEGWGSGFPSLSGLVGIQKGGRV